MIHAHKKAEPGTKSIDEKLNSGMRYRNTFPLEETIESYEDMPRAEAQGQRAPGNAVVNKVRGFCNSKGCIIEWIGNVDVSSKNRNFLLQDCSRSREGRKEA